MSNKIKAALYARVSTEEQAKEGYSILAQISEIEDYAQRNNMEIVQRYIDEGASGKSISGRPEMKRLLQDITHSKFNSVIVYKIDRIARKSKDAMDIAERCENENVSLISLKEKFDMSTPMGRMVFQIMSNFSEFERNTIIDRVKMGMIQRAKQGLYNGGKVLGYDSINKNLAINEAEAHIVRLIFDYAEKDLGYKAIVDRINDRGYKTKNGRLFSVNTIKTILDNPLYIGKIRFNLHENWSEKRRKGKNDDYLLVDGKHKAIISNAQWERVQSLRKKRSHKPTRSHEPFILSGLVKCPQCGHGMVPGRSQGHKGKSYRYYVCGQHHNKGKNACKAHSIRAEKVEEYVFNEIKRIVSEPYVLKKIVENVNQKRAEAKQPVSTEITITKSKLIKVEKRIQNITEQLMDEPSLLEIFKAKLVDMNNEKIVLQNKLEELNLQLHECDTAPIDSEALHFLLSNFESIITSVEPDRQKALLRLIIKDIIISKEAPHRIGRQVQMIKLHFDFTLQGLQGNTNELLQVINPEYLEPVEPWMLENIEGKRVSEMMSSLNILTLKEIRFTAINPKCSIHLLN